MRTLLVVETFRTSCNFSRARIVSQRHVAVTVRGKQVRSENDSREMHGRRQVSTLKLHSAAGRWVVAGSVLGSGAVFLESSVVNVALPAIARDFHVGVVGLQWVINGYLLTFSALMLLGRRARRSLRTSARVLDRLCRVRTRVGGVRAGARARRARGTPRGAGRRWRASRAEQPCDARRGLRGRGAGRRDRAVGSVVRRVDSGGSLRGRLARGCALVALGVLGGRALRASSRPRSSRGTWQCGRSATRLATTIAATRIDYAGAALGTLALAGIVGALMAAPVVGLRRLARACRGCWRRRVHGRVRARGATRVAADSSALDLSLADSSAA